jgi:hypothetical protein
MGYSRGKTFIFHQNYRPIYFFKLFFCKIKGMCDPGEKISQTLKREFMEEATDSTGKNKSSIKEIEEHLNSLFENGVEVSLSI